MAGMGNERHLKKGSKAPPPPEKDVLRVYGMKFCPYVQRLKLTLAAKGIKHENINVNLSEKPEWYFKKNPKGLVPTIEINDIVIYESDITSEYVDAVYPGKKLKTTDPLQKAKEAMLLSNYGKAISGFYARARAQSEEDKNSAGETLKEGLGLLDQFLAKNGKPFIGGECVDLTDYMVWPHLERIGAFFPEFLPMFENVHAYFKRMGEDKAVKACRWSGEMHKEFYKGYFKKDVNMYDIGEVLEYSFAS